MTLHATHIDAAFTAFEEIKRRLPHSTFDGRLGILQVATTIAQTAAIEEHNAMTTLAAEQLREINLSLLMLFNQGGPFA